MRWFLIRLDSPYDTDQQNRAELGVESELELQIPCPAGDIIRIVAAICRQDAKELGLLLRLNPGLLLLALIGYRRDHGCAPGDVKTLIQWCQTRLIALLRQSLLNKSVPESCFKTKKLSAFFDSFVRARSNKKLRSSLQRFLTEFCASDLEFTKSILAEIVGKKIRADAFKCKRIRKRRTQHSLVERWRELDRGFDLETLLDLAASHFESSIEIAERLHEEKLAAMKQLAYGASHEINNPLANVATRAQTMLAVETDPEKRHKLSVIYEQAMRAHEMISDMMLFAHPPTLQRERVSVRLMISNLINQLNQKYLSDPQIATTFTVAAGVDHVDVDPTQISVAIRSLIQNSFEALTSPPNSTMQAQHYIDVRIGSSKRGDLEIAVGDSGQPIEPEVVRHLFDPFYSGREAGRGLGFGLSKAWTIAKLHGGALSYDGQSEVGTRFVLTIPIKSDVEQSGPASALSICKNHSDVEEAA